LKTHHNFLGAWNLADFIFEAGINLVGFDYFFLLGSFLLRFLGHHFNLGLLVALTCPVP
jgi:hypothetical protein